MTDQEQPKPDKPSPLSPREFMRARRPAKFSDTVTDEKAIIDRSQLEYHLASITTRNDETLFAKFALQLAKREVAPNLLPQTGPVGGGDSKVDSETIPAAPSLALVWLTVDAEDAASTRWGFAFSAKKAWPAKLKADVAKLVGTKRGYTKAFFVTNQAVPDKKRAQLEDPLGRQYGIDVRILDRTWILDRVFNNHHEALAVEELHLTAPTQRIALKGPRDTEREQALQELERRIATAVAEGTEGFQFVDDCLEAALLARGLERPRDQGEGLFRRARRVAEKHGTKYQRLMAAYNYAWTAFWWYEDNDLFGTLYSTVEALAKRSRNVHELELLSNLWTVLRTAVFNEFLSESVALLKKRQATLARELKRLAKEVGRPSTTLQARALLLQMRLWPGSGFDPAEVIRDLQSVASKAEWLPGYPFDSFGRLMTEVGAVFGDLPEYAALFEQLAAATARRDGEVARGKLLLQRGGQQLTADRPYEAIRSLGRSLEDLAKYESREDVIRALYLCGAAYERAGLLWAARGTMLNAASIATNEFWRFEAITTTQLACYGRMKWLEVQLGRVPHALAWLEAEAMMSAMSQRMPDRDEWRNFDLMLGLLFLKADLGRLPSLGRLPDVLDRMVLENSASALRFSLGYDDEVSEAHRRSAEGDLAAFFRKWRDQPAADDLPFQAESYDGASVALRGGILGCTIAIQCQNDRVCLEASEALLAAVESFASTLAPTDAIAQEPRLTVDVRLAADVDRVAFEMHEIDGRPHMRILCPRLDVKTVTIEQRKQVLEVIRDGVAHICGRALLFQKADRSLQVLLRDEHAMVRAVSFAASYLAAENVFGHDAKLSTESWTCERSLREYTVRRTAEWDAADREAARRNRAEAEPLKFGTGEPPSELFDAEGLRHDRMQVASHIRMALWNQAEWQGVLYQTGGGQPPVVGLMFKDAEAAAAIFRGWRQEIGTVDKNGVLRIVIVKGIDKARPHHYRVAVGSNLMRGSATAKGTIFSMTRLLTMTPGTSANLDRFLEHFGMVGWCVLTYASFDSSQDVPQLMIEEGIALRIAVREAWELSRHDPDMAAITPADDPVIPAEHVSDAPVLQLLRWKTDQRESGAAAQRPGEEEATHRRKRRAPSARRGKRATRAKRPK